MGKISTNPNAKLERLLAHALGEAQKALNLANEQPRQTISAYVVGQGRRLRNLAGLLDTALLLKQEPKREQPPLALTDEQVADFEAGRGG